MQKVMPVTKADNSVVGKQSAIVIEGHTTFMTWFKVSEMLKKKKEKVSTSMISLDLKLPYLVEL